MVADGLGLPSVATKLTGTTGAVEEVEAIVVVSSRRLASTRYYRDGSVVYNRV